ncbi:DNA/RNA non-specific endonuclease [Lactococcus termiticola]|uniref:Type VII secretion system protein EssD-like domain-containing protein n=1 Tax=Lactococcus termiticola TaxID=2169526 RepID=A0A2R5HHG6_9LACT|nr:DNA/RNA non-specific endonuclease [Lactococcus termiticola]GBG97454.1 hypothetical protein NtB2_01599 [Lactococcus termiticola]
MKKYWILAAAVLSLSILTACGSSQGQGSQQTSSSSTRPSSSQKASSSLASKAPAQSSPQTSESKAAPASRPADNSAILAKLVELTDAHSPGENKDYYWENGPAKLSGFEGMKAGDSKFEGDSQGRSTTARAVLTYELFKSSKGSRQGEPLAPPSWPSHNPKVAISYSLTGKTYHGYLYNRSHSIADSLLGAGSYKSAYNFTTGTRPQNVGADQNGGMRAAEERAESYWKSHPDSTETISYMTTPLYQGDEKLPRGSVVDMKSSDGELDCEIVVINDVEGMGIDYASGVSSDAGQTTTPPKEEASPAPATTAPATETAPAPTSQDRTVYVASKGNSKVYWYSTADMPASTNQANVVSMTESEALAQGKRHSYSE